MRELMTQHRVGSHAPRRSRYLEHDGKVLLVDEQGCALNARFRDEPKPKMVFDFRRAKNCRTWP